MDETIAFTVNGQARTVTSARQRPLLDVLREDLKLTGVKNGCGEGKCGSCTVLLDGKPVTSCNTPVGDAAGKTILTIEGLAKGEALHPVQEAFLTERALQCGYCTPGMVLAAVALLGATPNPTDAQIASALDGHLCRCGTYARILKAVRRAATQKAGRAGL
jgi:aerobic-type carbon monoxide dehydrogenase small subunit (CoxS/CutS family)